MFFFSLNVAITGYVNSTLMKTAGLSDNFISALYVGSALITLSILPLIPRITNKIGNTRFVILLLTTSLLSILGILFIKQNIILGISFIFFLIINFLVIFEMDVFLEHFSDTKHTGRIRGIFFTIINLTWALSPLLAGILIEHLNISWVYIIGSISVVLSGVVIFTKLRSTKFKKKILHSTKASLTRMLKNKNLRNIFLLSSMLHFFYSFSAIYLPLYLFSTIGFTWVQIGALILIGNIPFLLLGYPIGYLSDIWGEKQLLITGIIISILGTLGFILTKEPQFFAWAILFFVSRIGISTLETTSESYTFKNIEHDDTETLSIQRDATPFGYIIAPVMGYVIQIFTDSYIPIFIGVIIVMLLSFYPAIKLKNNHVN